MGARPVRDRRRKGGTLSKKYDLTEIPVFVKRGSMLPTVPLQLGKVE